MRTHAEHHAEPGDSDESRELSAVAHSERTAQRFVSIERKVLLPAAAVFTLFAVALAALQWMHWHDDHGEALATEARLISEGVARLATLEQREHATDANTHAQLQSYVEGLASTEEHVLIVVAAGDPRKVIAATVHAWVGVEIDRLEPCNDAALVQRATGAAKTAGVVTGTESGRSMRSVELADGAIVIVGVGSDPRLAPALASTLLVTLAGVVALGLTLAAAVAALRRHVTRPLVSLAQGVGENGTLHHAERPSRTIDEVTVLARTLTAARARAADSREEIERLSLVARNTRNAVAITDVARRIVWTNAAFTRLTGYSFEEVRGRVPGSFLQCGHTNPASIRELRRALAVPEPVRLDILNRSKSGREYWVDIEIQPLRDEHGVHTGFMAVGSEITEEVVAREKLTESERRVKLIVSSADLATWEWDAVTGHLDVNERWAGAVGCTIEELAPHYTTWLRFVHPDDRESTLALLDAHLAGKSEYYRAEYRRVAKDGSILWVVDSGGVTARDASGKPLRMAGVNLDITELRRAQERFELCVRGSAAGIWDWNPNSGALYMSPRYKELLGYRDDELESSADVWWSRIHEVDGARVKHELDAHVQNGTPLRSEYRLRHKDGTYHWYLCTGQAWRDSCGRVHRVTGSLEDISERRAIEISRERLASIVEHSDDAIFELSLDGIIVSCNEAAASMFQMTVSQLVGSSEQRLIPTDEGQGERAALGRIANGERVGQYDSMRLRGDGSRFDVSVSLAAVRDESEVIIGAAKIVRDISSRREKRDLQAANALLGVQNHRLAELTERAHRFVDDVSHEFRTPLTVIKEYASLVSDGLGGAVTEQQADWLQVIEAASSDLNQLVEDFLDSSKLRTGRLRVDRRACDAWSIVQGVERLVAHKAATRKIRIVDQIAQDVGPIFADEEKVRRVILNLLSNALKFSPEGGTITLAAAMTAEGDVEFSVTDHGPGLTPSDREQLFTRFQTLPNALAPAVKGFGLGLNIVQQLVWLNLGVVRVTSEPGNGARFSFTVPVVRAERIVQRFFDRLREREEVPRAVGLMHVRLPQSLGSSTSTAATADPEAQRAQLEMLRKLAVAGTRPSDVVMVAADGLSLAVFGPTESVDDWRARLVVAMTARSEGQARVPEIATVGCWDFPTNEAGARDGINGLVVGSGKVPEGQSNCPATQKESLPVPAPLTAASDRESAAPSSNDHDLLSQEDPIQRGAAS